MLRNAIVYVYRYIPIERNLLTAREIVECIIIQRKWYPSAAIGIGDNVGCKFFLIFIWKFIDDHKRKMTDFYRIGFHRFVIFLSLVFSPLSIGRETDIFFTL